MAGSTASHTYAAAGLYTVTVTVTGAAGQKVIADYKIMIRTQLAAFARTEGDAATAVDTRQSSIKTVEWEHIHQTLVDTDFNVSETARRLATYWQPYHQQLQAELTRLKAAHGTVLLQMGCELAQGYGIARPMPPDQLPAWAATARPSSSPEGVRPAPSPRRRRHAGRVSLRAIPTPRCARHCSMRASPPSPPP